MKYSDSVDYHKIDPVKVMAQKAAKKTATNLNDFGFHEVKESRGESAYVVDMGNYYIASITECLGTKTLVADEMKKITGKTYYDSIAQDTIAMAVNDISTVGARPLSIHAYWAVGDDQWFEDNERTKDLIVGWGNACHLCGASWGGGETPSLSGVIATNAINLAASCIGIIKPKNRLSLGNKLQSGDSIILLESSGIHANGLTMARKLAQELNGGYASKMSNGELYGEGLLKPTIIYASIINTLFEAGIDIHYMANITGHGWRKIMRHPKELTYRIFNIPPLPEVLRFMVEKGDIEPQEAYGSLNMGAGYAIYLPKSDVEKALSLSKKLGIRAYEAGLIENGSKQIIIEPLDIVYLEDSLQLN